MRRLFFIAAFTLIGCTTAFGVCDCFEIPSHRKEFRWSNAVFVGEVVKIDRGSPKDREKLPKGLSNELGDQITFRVVRKWKGKNTTEVIWTHATDVLCAKWRFEIGQEYLIYVRKHKQVSIGAEYCSRTRPIGHSDADKERELKELDTYK